jgi:hypothetical protein
MVWIDIDQVRDEEKWLNLRIGKIGGSSIGKIMANDGKAFGAPAHDVALKIALEKIKGQREESGFQNEHTERGKAQEPIARMLYEEKTFCKVTNGGFYDVSEYVGVSPDGLVGDEGIVEIKSVIAKQHFPTIKRGSFDPTYKWQLYFNLMCSGRVWIDYIEYCSEFPSGKQLFIDRVYAKDCESFFHQINARLNEFKGLILSKIELINNIN